MTSSRPATAASHESSVLIALAMGRGISEMGLCCLDLLTSECTLYQACPIALLIEL